MWLHYLSQLLEDILGVRSPMSSLPFGDLLWDHAWSKHINLEGIYSFSSSMQTKGEFFFQSYIISDKNFEVKMRLCFFTLLPPTIKFLFVVSSLTVQKRSKKLNSIDNPYSLCISINMWIIIFLLLCFLFKDLTLLSLNYSFSLWLSICLLLFLKPMYIFKHILTHWEVYFFLKLPSLCICI